MIGVIADGLNERRFLDDQAIGELGISISGAAGFGGMDATGGPVQIGLPVFIISCACASVVLRGSVSAASMPFCIYRAI